MIISVYCTVLLQGSLNEQTPVQCNVAVFVNIIDNPIYVCQLCVLGSNAFQTTSWGHLHSH